MGGGGQRIAQYVVQLQPCDAIRLASYTYCNSSHVMLFVLRLSVYTNLTLYHCAMLHYNTAVYEFADHGGLIVMASDDGETEWVVQRRVMHLYRSATPCDAPYT
jgi:hypothetical protein